MTQKSILKNFSESIISESMKIFEKINDKDPVTEKIVRQYEFKNDLFNKEIKTSQKNFEEFFTRRNVKSKIEKIDDFDDAVQILSRYPSKVFSERDLSAKSVFHSLIENYVYHVGDFVFITKEFEYIFKNFIKFLDSGILEVHYFVPIFQLSFPSRYSQKQLGDLTLSKISSEQFKIVKESLVGNRSTPGYLRKLEYVLETTVSFENNPENEDSNASNRFSRFLNVCRLFTEGDVRLGPFYKNYTFWTMNSSKILNIHEIQIGKKNIKLNNSSYSDLKKFYTNFRNINLENKEWSFIQVAIDRFSSSISRHDVVDKIVDLNVALECLFSSPGETSLKISNRTALIMGPDEDDQENCWNFIKNTYKLRNSILHGRKNPEDISDDVKELERIVRSSIRKFLNLSENLSLSELKSQNKLTKGDTVRDYILDELDLGLINRLKLEIFKKNLNGSFT